jgi:dihydrofolate synthase/folylpolyglutamate synthase
MVKDKDIEKVLQLLPAYANYYFTQARIPRALEAHLLRQQAQGFNLNGEAYAEVNIALKAAIAAAKKEDLIIVCGSVFVVGDVELS